jgi:hypothetical protein
MKKVISVIAIVLITFMFTNCGLEHEQCEESIHVRECDAITGECEDFIAFRIVEC